MLVFTVKSFEYDVWLNDNTLCYNAFCKLQLFADAFPVLITSIQVQLKYHRKVPIFSIKAVIKAVVSPV